MFMFANNKHYLESTFHTKIAAQSTSHNKRELFIWTWAASSTFPPRGAPDSRPSLLAAELLCVAFHVAHSDYPRRYQPQGNVAENKHNVSNLLTDWGENRHLYRKFSLVLLSYVDTIFQSGKQQTRFKSG